VDNPRFVESTIHAEVLPVAENIDHGRVYNGAFDEVFKAVLAGVDHTLEHEFASVWQKGSGMLHHIQEVHNEQLSQFQQEVAAFQAKQRLLQMENAGLFHRLNCMLGEVAYLGSERGTEKGRGVPDMERPADIPAGSLLAHPRPNFSNAMPISLEVALRDLKECRNPRRSVALTDALSTCVKPTSVPLNQSPSPLVAWMCDMSDFMFSFTISVADGLDVGLEATHQEQGSALRVESVRPSSAVDAWNRQCVTGGSPEKAVVPGDRIVSVNSHAYDSARMLRELCRCGTVLRITIVRVSGDAMEVGPKPSA